MESTSPTAPSQPAVTAPVAEVPRSALRQDRPLSSINPTSGLPSGGAILQADFSAEEFLDQPLADVIVEGNKTIQLNAILKYIESRPGRTASPRLIQDDVSKLLNTRWFFSVRPIYRDSENGPILVFQVVERPIINSVTFVGNKKIKTEELQSHTGLRAGHGFDVAANRESVHRLTSLYKERGYRFAEVTLEKGGSPDDRDIVFQIKEGSKVKIWDVNIRGSKFSSQAVLKTKLKTKTVIAWIIGGDYDPDIVRNDILALKQYYMNLGFFDVEVEAEELFSEDKSKVTVNFHVKEGTRYRVRNTQVVGNGVIPAERLMEVQKLKSGDAFNARFLKEDVTFMKDQYDEQGRLFAEVNPVPQFIADEEGWVDLLYQIDEDVPRYVGQINIHIRGDYPHTKEDVVRKQVDRFIKPGRLASGKDLRMAQARVRGSGIWEASDPAAFDLKPVDGLDYLPKLEMRGQDVDFESILQASATVSEDAADESFGHSLSPLAPPSRGIAPKSVPASMTAPAPRAYEPEAKPEVRFQSPDGESRFGIDPDLVFRAQSPAFYGPAEAPPAYRSQSLDAYGNQVPQDYLQRVSPQGDPFGDALSAAPPGFVDVNIDVTEGRTGRLMFGVGVNSDAGVVGSLVLQEDNFDFMRPPRSWADIINGQAFRGAGQSFRMEAVPGSEVSRYMVSWQDPFFMRTDFSLSTSGFYYNRFFRNWTEDRLGGRISLGYVLDRYWSVSTALRLENVDVHGFATPAPADLQAVKGDNFLSTASGTLSFDMRDNSFTPTRGSFVDFTYEQGFGEFNYPRFDITGGQYFTTYERPDGFGKHVLALTGEVGWTGDDTPIFERFYAGGYSSFRGFAFRGVTPVQGGVELGGNFMMLGSAEYMVPLTASDNIRGVVFTDFGTVESDVSLDEFRLSAGFGFRLVIPAMGPAPLAFDFAWPIMQEDFDRKRVFSFYVGFTR